MRRAIHLAATAVVMAVAVYVVICGARQGRLAECLVLTAMICPVLLFVLALVMETVAVLFKLSKTTGAPDAQTSEKELEETTQEA